MRGRSGVVDGVGEDLSHGQARIEVRLRLVDGDGEATRLPEECLTHAGVHTLEDGVLSRVHLSLEPLERCPPGLGDRNAPHTSIGEIDTALDQTRVDERVDDIWHHGLVDAEVPRQPNLCRGVVVADHREDLKATQPMRHIGDGFPDTFMPTAQYHAENPAQV